MGSIAEYQEILGSVANLTGFPALCQNLDARYTSLNSNFTAFDVCIIYPDLILGLDAGSFDPAFTAELEGYGVKRLNNAISISQDVTNQTVHFLMDACEKIQCNNQLSRDHNNTCNEADLRNDTLPTLNLEAVNSCRDAICENLQNYVQDDPDIGGIGVFISYILQMFLVLLMSAYILWKYILHERRVNPEDMHSPFVGSKAFPESLQDFQKLQSWFIGSLVVAAFIRQVQEIDSISVTDFLFLGGISLNGVVLICYMNAALLLLGRKSWYVFGLSCITFGMCSAFLFYANWKRKARVEEVLPALSFCQPQLKALKYAEQIIGWVRLVSRLPPIVVYAAWGFCAAIQIGCVFWMLELEKRFPHGFKKWTKSHVGKFCMWLATFFIVLAFFGIFALQMVMLYNFWGVVDPSFWSFGQIIAVTIWLPVVIDYLHGRYKEKRELAGAKYAETSTDGYSVVPLMANPYHYQPYPNVGPGTPGLGWSTPSTTNQPYDTHQSYASQGSHSHPPQQPLYSQYGFVPQNGELQYQPQTALGYTSPITSPPLHGPGRPTHQHRPSQSFPPASNLGSLHASESPESSAPIPVPLQSPSMQSAHPTQNSPNYGRTTPQSFGSPPAPHHQRRGSQTSTSTPMQQHPGPNRPIPPSAWDHNTDYFGTQYQPPRRREVGSRRSSGASEHSRSRSGSGFDPA